MTINVRKYAGGSFINLKDLKDKPPLLEQISFVLEEVDGKFGARLVVTFESGKKLSLNATSVGNLMRDIGDVAERWTGHDVKVFAGEVPFQSGTTRCVLVEGIDVDKPPTEKSARGDPNDEIPF